MDDFAKAAKLAEEAKKDADDGEKLLPNYPLVRFTDLPELTKPDIVDFVSGAVERYADELEEACKAIKEEMERLYGTFWHVIIGENFGYDVTYQTTNLLYMFVGPLGVLIWKCR